MRAKCHPPLVLYSFLISYPTTQCLLGDLELFGGRSVKDSFRSTVFVESPSRLEVIDRS